jgi:HEAT repeat protein
MPHLTVNPFTRELARLVWLLANKPAAVDEQKAALRSVLLATRNGGSEVVQTEIGEWIVELTAAGSPPAELPWLSELAGRMASHSVRKLEILPQPKAAELLALARALVAEGVRGDQGAAFDARMSAIEPSTITAHLGRDGFVRHATPPVGMRAYAGPARTPPRLDAVAADPPAASSAPATPAASEQAQIVTRAFSRPSGNQGLDDLIVRLRGSLDREGHVILDEVCRYAEERARQGKWLEVVDVIDKLMEREVQVTHPDLKRTFGVQYRRLSTPAILKGLAELLPRERDAREKLMAFFARAGNPAADLLVDLLTTAESPTDRRAYRDAIAQCPSAAIPLIHQLRHPQWYVVRNAAELLGEMGMVEADSALIEAVDHADARVRRAATLALIRLGTPKAVYTMVRALGDAEASIRLAAVRGLAALENPRAVPALLAALDSEKDDDVQQAIFSALGRQATREAVDRLVREAQPAGLLQRKRPLARRLAAVTALGEASTHEARSALRSLERDKEQDVRSLAETLLRSETAAAER